MLSKLKTIKGLYWVLIAIATLLPYLLEIRAINVFVSSFFTHLVLPAIEAVLSPIFNLYIRPFYDYLAVPLFKFFKSNPEMAPIVSVLVALLAVIITQFWFDKRQRKEHLEQRERQYTDHEKDWDIKRQNKYIDKKEEVLAKLIICDTKLIIILSISHQINNSNNFNQQKELKNEFEKIHLEILSHYDYSRSIIDIYFNLHSKAANDLQQNIASYVANCLTSSRQDKFNIKLLSEKYEIVRSHYESLYKAILNIDNEFESKQ